MTRTSTVRHNYFCHGICYSQLQDVLTSSWNNQYVAAGQIISCSYLDGHDGLFLQTPKAGFVFGKCTLKSWGSLQGRSVQLVFTYLGFQ